MKDADNRGPGGPILDDGVPPFPHKALLVLDRGPRYVLVVDVTEFRGWPRLGIRKWQWTPRSGWIPTGDGAAIAPNEADAFAEAVARGRDEVVERERAIVESIEARRSGGGPVRP